MKVVDFLRKNSIIPNLNTKEKDGVISELADHISREEQLDRDLVYKILIERERLGSTGLGEGVAIPHGRMSSLTRLVACFARSVDGVNFDAIDGNPSHLFFVLLTPDNHMGLQALARVSKLMREVEFRKSLMCAVDLDDLYARIVAEDSKI